MCSTKRVLPHPVGPLSSTGRRALYAAVKISTSSSNGRENGAAAGSRWGTSGPLACRLGSNFFNSIPIASFWADDLTRQGAILRDLCATIQGKPAARIAPASGATLLIG